MTSTCTQLFVTGIDTGVGKTIAAAILAQAYAADYWKPVQCGELAASDSARVTGLVSHADFRAYPEAWRFDDPVSPHLAAARAGVKIGLDDFSLPTSERSLIVEGAGGILCPLSHELTMADLAAQLGLAVVVVTRLYLGALNHTFLTVEALRQRGLSVAGLMINGEDEAGLSEFIVARTGLPLLLRLSTHAELSPALIRAYAQQLRIPPQFQTGTDQFQTGTDQAASTESAYGN